MFAEKFNRIFEPKDLKSAYKLNYLLGSGITFLGFTQGYFNQDPVIGVSLVAVGQLLTGLAFDYRNQRIEDGYDALKHKVVKMEG